MNKLAVAAVAAASVCMFGLAGALAQGSNEFNSVDGNKDGTVSFEEASVRFPGLMQAIFDMADADDDGLLDDGEYTQLKGLVNAPDEPDSSTSSIVSSLLL